jgi:hypothetical protein
MVYENYELEFGRVVPAAFARLSAEYHFTVVESTRLRVTFENERLRVLVCQKHIWDQIDVVVGRHEPAYGLDTIERWLGIDHFWLQIGNSEVLLRLLTHVADVLCDRAGDILQGSDAAFAGLRTVQAAIDEEYNRKLTGRQ